MSLSHKRYYFYRGSFYEEKDVKEALKNVVKKVKNPNNHTCNRKEKLICYSTLVQVLEVLKSEFGEEMLK
jgi:hypothetical protein